MAGDKKMNLGVQPEFDYIPVTTTYEDDMITEIHGGQLDYMEHLQYTIRRMHTIPDKWKICGFIQVKMETGYSKYLII
jgi:hypothetical protein